MTATVRWRFTTKNLANRAVPHMSQSREWPATVDAFMERGGLAGPNLNCERSWFRSYTSDPRLWLATVDCSTIATTCCFPRYMAFVAK